VVQPGGECSENGIKELKIGFGIERMRCGQWARHSIFPPIPLSWKNVRDNVGLYLNPPENALVLCVDEKSQYQALERSQTMLPLGFGHTEGYTHDYLRHGTLTLFAALDVATWAVLAHPKKRRRHHELFSFSAIIDASVPPELDVQIIMENYATHKHEKVRFWFAKKSRYHVHFTPTYSSLLNQVETWFGIISR
jgi:putative transposase